MFKKADSLFTKKLKQVGIAGQVEATQQLEIARQVLLDEFGEGAEKHATPQSVKNRVLTISIVHPAIAEQIRETEEHIIHCINKKIGRAEITRIQFSTQQRQF